MFAFVVFDRDGLALNRVLRHAFIVGHDGVPVAGEVHVERGIIHAVKPAADAAALATQVDLDPPTLDEIAPLAAEDPASSGLPELEPLGTLTLQTCLLPERRRPYLLSLELARHRIMLILHKLEDWQLTDLASAHPAMQLFDAARRAFTLALVHQADGATSQTAGFSLLAHRHAVRSLWLAVEASDRLANLATARDFVPRMNGSMYARAAARFAEPSLTDQPSRPGEALPSPVGVGKLLPTRPAIGVTASPASFLPAAQNVVATACDFVNVPMRWIDLEPGEGSYAFASTDRWIEWAVRTARKPVVGGPLIDFRPGAAPDWLFIWENDYETLRELVFDHVKAIVTRYRRTVPRWTVASGLHTNSAFRLSFEQIMDLTRLAVGVVRKLHPQARVQIEIAQPWGEYYTQNRRALPPTLYAEMLLQAGVPIDTIGVRLEMGAPQVGQSCRDPAAVSALLDQYAALERPLTITAAAPSAPLSAPADHPDLNPGWWRRSWDEQAQADWMGAVFAVALAKPCVQSVCWAELMDTSGSPEMPSSGLLDSAGTARAANARLAELRRAVASAVLPASFEPEPEASRLAPL